MVHSFASVPEFRMAALLVVDQVSLKTGVLHVVAPDLEKKTNRKLLLSFF